MGALVLISNTCNYLIMVKISQAIACRLAKGSEIVRVGCIDKKVRNVVLWPHSDIVGAKVALGVTVALVCRLEREHLVGI